MSHTTLPADERLQRLHQWLLDDLRLGAGELSVASADASFRRYFRWRESASGLTRIVMDAPPQHESLDAYLAVTALLRGVDVHAPQVFEVATDLGYVLLEDLGATPYLEALRAPGRASALYGAAQLSLASMQLRLPVAELKLPVYDDALLRREMNLMPEWFCTRHLDLSLTAEDTEFLAFTMEEIIAVALEQPKVFVHRDYHSRNLMVLAQDGPGVIDYQDAVVGPVGYDLVSLFKDCYIRWPRESVESWLRGYRYQLRAAGRMDLIGCSEREFFRWFDFMGVQRHLKVLGIFARLHWRDGKSGYLADLPLTLDYLLEACARHEPLQALAHWLERRIEPQLVAANARALQTARSA